MRPLALWRHEIRRAGWAPLLASPLLAGGLVGITWAEHPMRNLFVFLELGVPLVAGLGAASLTGRDPAAELQLTMPMRYRSTLLRRLAVTAGWSALVAVLISAILILTGRWPAAHGPITGQLVWLAPGVWLTAFGLLAGVLLRGPAAAGGLVAVLWLVEQLFGAVVQEHGWSRAIYLFATTQGTVPAEWAANRITLVATGLGLGLGAYLLLGRAR